ncbi:MAG: 16S rRNA (guanine(966)-N(2))-methyltransferase RsmD [Pseudomonadota bacterium]
MRIIAGMHRGRRLIAPKGKQTRPTTDRSREALFSALSHQLDQDFSERQVLDLFAGSGALGLEALSRGAAHATFVERAPAAVDSINANIDALGLAENTKILKADATRPPRTIGPFNLVFIDPPYDLKRAASSILACIDAQIVAEDVLFCLDSSIFEADLLPDLPLSILWSKRVSQSHLTICSLENLS